MLSQTRSETIRDSSPSQDFAAPVNRFMCTARTAALKTQFREQYHVRFHLIHNFLFNMVHLKYFSLAPDSSGIGCRTSYQSSIEVSEHGFLRS
jgi:hypothetical protein